MTVGNDVPPAPPPRSADEVRLWDPVEMLRRGWRHVAEDPTTVLVVALALVLANVISMAGGVLGGLLESAGDHVAGSIVRFATVVLNFPVAVYFQMTIVGYSLDVARGLRPGVGRIFAGGPYLRFLGAHVLTAIGVVLGLVLCIVPGVILWLGWFVVHPLVVDRKLGPIEALQESWRLTRGHKGLFFVFALLMIALQIVGLLACCVGVLVTTAILNFSFAHIYLRLAQLDGRLDVLSDAAPPPPDPIV